MKDQVDALVARGVKAANLDSTLTLERSTWVKDEVLSGSMKILYVAPERSVLRVLQLSLPQILRELDLTTRCASCFVLTAIFPG